MMQDTKTSEPSKFPVASAPQKTYTYEFDQLFRRLSWVAGGVLGELCLFIAAFVLGLGGWKAIFILFLMISLPVIGLVVHKRRKKGFITIAPEGLTFGGAFNIKEGIKSDFNQEDFNKVSHFDWEQIKSVGFTRDLMRPSYLFVELTDGETYYFPLLYYQNNIVIIDNLRRFTGYFGCKDLGRYIPYVKQLKRKDSSPQT